MIARRHFLAGAALAPFAFHASRKSCIFLHLTGGPSQIDTWDPKPEARSEVRGPFRAIRTNVPGIQISELFPRMAKCADRYTLVRSVYSNAAPDHGSALELIDQATEGFVTLPGPLGFIDQPLSHVRGSETLRSRERERAVGRFGEDCLRARQLVERGIASVRVNMFDTVFHRTTWDSHGYRPFSTIEDQRTVAAIFDAAYTTLLEDLHQRGLLESTLVVAMGEFGRSPRINPQGGRDHWTRCQTVLLAGGGISGGEVWGSSDGIAAEPKDKPLSLARLLGTIRTPDVEKLSESG